MFSGRRFQISMEEQRIKDRQGSLGENQVGNCPVYTPGLEQGRISIGYSYRFWQTEIQKHTCMREKFLYEGLNWKSAETWGTISNSQPSTRNEWSETICIPLHLQNQLPEVGGLKCELLETSEKQMYQSGLRRCFLMHTNNPELQETSGKLPALRNLCLPTTARRKLKEKC